MGHACTRLGGGSKALCPSEIMSRNIKNSPPALSGEIVQRGATMTIKPVVFFDFGGTLLDLEGLLSAARQVVGKEFRLPSSRAGEVAALWSRKTSRRILWHQGKRFASEKVIAAQTLQEVLLSGGIKIQGSQASHLVRLVWRLFEHRAQFCPDISVEWLARMRNLSSGLGLVTDG